METQNELIIIDETPIIAMTTNGEEEKAEPVVDDTIPENQEQDSPVIDSPVNSNDKLVDVESPEKQEQVPKAKSEVGRFGFKDKVSSAIEPIICERYTLSEQQIANFHGNKYVVTYLAAFGKTTENISCALEKHKDSYESEDASVYHAKGTAAMIGPEALYTFQYLLLLPCLAETDSKPINWKNMPPTHKEHSYAGGLGKRAKYTNTIKGPAEPVINCILNQQNFVNDLKKKTEKKEKTDEMNKQPTNKSKPPIYTSNGSRDKQPSDTKMASPEQPLGKNGIRSSLGGAPTKFQQTATKDNNNNNTRKITFQDQQMAQKSGTAPSLSLSKAGASVQKIPLSPSLAETYTMVDVYKIVTSLSTKIDELKNEMQEVKASLDTLKSNNTTTSPPKSRQGGTSRAHPTKNKAGFNDEDSEVAIEVSSLEDVCNAVLTDIKAYHKELIDTTDGINNKREREKKAADLPFFKKIADFDTDHYKKWMFALHFLSLISQKDLFGKKLDPNKFTPNNTARLAFAILDIKDLRKTLENDLPLERLLTCRPEGTYYMNKSNYEALLKQIKFIYISFYQRDNAPSVDPKKGKGSNEANGANKKSIPDAPEDIEDGEENESNEDIDDNRELGEDEEEEDHMGEDETAPEQYRGYGQPKGTNKSSSHSEHSDLDDENDDHPPAKLANGKAKENADNPNRPPQAYMNAIHTMFDANKAAGKKRSPEPDQKPTGSKVVKLVTTTSAAAAPLSDFNEDDFGDDDNDDGDDDDVEDEQ
jgi:hypothetical protein